MTGSAPDLTRLFAPRAVAIAGASTNVDSPGHDYLRSLQAQGFAGPIYPLNLRASEVAGLPAYPSLLDVPGEVDLVISCVPAAAVLDLVEQCARKRVPFLHLFTGRFSETGDDAAATLEREVAARAAAGGVRILGPNGMGLYHPAAGLSFRPDLPTGSGGVAFLSQSGNNAVEVILRGHARGLRFGKVANYGNGMDLTPAVLLGFLAADPETAVIGAYVEGVPDGRAFFDALRDAASRKPVIVHKAGRTAAGAGSAASHTAALAGSAAVWSAAIRQAGALEARSQEQLLDLMVGATLLRPARGRRVAVAGGGGGRSVQSADACEEAGLDVAPLPEVVRDQVRAKAPALADWLRNPVDQSILAGSGLSSNAVLELMVASGAYDIVIANVGEDWFFARPDAEARLRHACSRLAALATTAAIPVAVVLGATETADAAYRRMVDLVRDDFVASGVAVFPTVERAAATLAGLSRLSPKGTAPMTVKLAKDAIDIGIVVRDPAAALTFYRDTLGLEHVATLQMPGGAVMERLQCGGTVVKLVSPPEMPAGANPPGGPMAATGIRYWTIPVTNLDELLAKCGAAGYRIIVPRRTSRPGLDIGMVADPDGNVVEFIESTAS